MIVLNRHSYDEPGKTFYYVVLQLNGVYCLLLKQLKKDHFAIEAYPTIDAATTCFGELLKPIKTGKANDPALIHSLHTLLRWSPLIIGFKHELEELMRYALEGIVYKSEDLYTDEPAGLLRMQTRLQEFIVLDVLKDTIPSVEVLTMENGVKSVSWKNIVDLGNTLIASSICLL